MNELPTNVIYPEIVFAEHVGRFVPDVLLPLDFKAHVPPFYRKGGREDLETYVSRLRNQFELSHPELILRLRWDETLGLTNINVSSQSGLDLNTKGIPSFQEQNTGGIMALVGYAIATKYVKGLLNAL